MLLDNKRHGKAGNAVAKHIGSAAHFRKPKYTRKSDELAREMRAGGKREFHEFVLFHQQLPRWFAQRYRQLTDDLEDLTQVAMVGLVRAARVFHPERGVTFAGFALLVMQQDCMRYLASAVRLGRVPYVPYKSFIKVLQKTALAWHEGGPVAAEVRLEQAGQEEGLAPDATEDLRRFFEAKHLDPTNAPRQSRRVGAVEYDDEFSTGYREPLAELDHTEQVCLLREVLSTLNGNDWTIIRRRFGLSCEAQTLDEVAAQLHLTREAIRQREQKVLLVLRGRARLRLDISTPEDGERPGWAAC